MHTGEILVVLGIVSVALFVMLVIYLIRSSKRNRMYQEILLQETKPFDAFNSTVQYIEQEKTSSSASIHVESSVLSNAEGTMLDVTEAGLMDYQRTGHALLPQDMTMLEEDDATAGENLYDILGGEFGLSSSYHPSGLDWSPLEGQYEYISEITGGGMGSVFKVLKTNTGNEWIAKFIPKHIGELTQEADILKKLNHVNLPSIIDVFENDAGQFLVESFVEGVGMDQVLKSRPDSDRPIPVYKVMAWAEQMAQVLSYLHNLEDNFLHLDLKPGNIMVTHDDKLVLIDFGISQRQSEATGSKGATLKYCAPEQVPKKLSGDGLKLINYRFNAANPQTEHGLLPEERNDWALTVKTDIYSLGVILYEAATGIIPQHKNMNLLRKYLPANLCEIILRCLEINPADRYDSIDDLLADIQRQQQSSKSKMHYSLLARKAAGFGSVAAVGLAVFSFAMGAHLIDVEARTVMTIDPAILTVSVLQSSEIRLARLLPETDEERPLNQNNLQWELSASDIAQVDGNRIVGLNVGETIVHGQYRHNSVSMQVQVVEPMDGIVEIAQRYPMGNEVFLFAGSTHRERLDGALASGEFVSPGSMDISERGAVYLTDSGVLRRIYNGILETIEINPPFLRPNIVRTYGNDVFTLTDEWYDDGFWYGIIRLSDGGAEGFFLGDAIHTAIRDFVVSNGLIYFIEWNAGVGAAYLRTINVNDANDIHTLLEVPEGVSALTLDGNRIFLADSEEGVLLVYENGELRHLAGVAGDRAFIDGAAPLFYQPSRLRFNDNDLYIWDFNVLRKLRLEDGMALEAISLVGAVSPVYDLIFPSEREPAERIVLPYSRLMDFVFLDDALLLSDPKRGVIWKK